MTFITGNGIAHTDAAVWIKIPFIGEREALILDDSPPAISMYEEIEAGNDFKWKEGVGPLILRSDGATCQVERSSIWRPWEMEGLAACRNGAPVHAKR